MLWFRLSLSLSRSSSIHPIKFTLFFVRCSMIFFYLIRRSNPALLHAITTKCWINYSHCLWFGFNLRLHRLHLMCSKLTRLLNVRLGIFLCIYCTQISYLKSYAHFIIFIWRKIIEATSETSLHSCHRNGWNNLSEFHMVYGWWQVPLYNLIIQISWKIHLSMK